MWDWPSPEASLCLSAVGVGLSSTRAPFMRRAVQDSVTYSH